LDKLEAKAQLENMKKATSRGIKKFKKWCNKRKLKVDFNCVTPVELNELLQNSMLELRWLNTVFMCALANAIQCTHKDCNKTTNMASIQRSFYLLNAHAICTVFLHNWTQCIDGFSLLHVLQWYVRKGDNAKNPAILSFFFVTKRTQLNAAHP